MSLVRLDLRRGPWGALETARVLPRFFLDVFGRELRLLSFNLANSMLFLLMLARRATAYSLLPSLVGNRDRG